MPSRRPATTKCRSSALSTGDYSCVNPLLTELMNRLAAKKVAVSLALDACRCAGAIAARADQARAQDRLHAGARSRHPTDARHHSEGIPGGRADRGGSADLLARVALAEALLHARVAQRDRSRPAWASSTCRRRSPPRAKFRAQVTASVSNFVPKSHTPFQWAAQIPIAEIEARQRFLRREFGKAPHPVPLARCASVVSRGDLLARRPAHGRCAVARLSSSAAASTAGTTHAASTCGSRRCATRAYPPTSTCAGACWMNRCRGTTSAAGSPRRSCSASWRMPSNARSPLTAASNAARTAAPATSPRFATSTTMCAAPRVPSIAAPSSTIGPSDIVSGSDESGAWEPRGWHKIRAKARGQQRHAAPSAAACRAVSQRRPGHQAARSDLATGLGNAEEWLSAGGEALAPVVDTSAPAAQARIRLTYTQSSGARASSAAWS